MEPHGAADVAVGYHRLMPAHAELLLPIVEHEHEEAVLVGVTRCAWTGIGRCREPQLADRKSTRLNSSHVRISYAVFCLKKKKDLVLLFRGRLIRERLTIVDG